MCLRPLLMYQVPDSVAGDVVGCACQTKFKLSIFWKVCAFLEVTVKNKQIRIVNAHLKLNFMLGLYLKPFVACMC